MGSTALFPRSIIYCRSLPSLFEFHRDAGWISFSSVFCSLCDSHHGRENKYTFPNTGNESFVIQVVRNKKLCHHRVTKPSQETRTDSMTQSFRYPDLGLSFCKTWDRKNVDNGQRTEPKEENFFLTWISGMFIGLLIMPSLEGRPFTFLKPILRPWMFWQLQSLFSSLHLCQMI